MSEVNLNVSDMGIDGGSGVPNVLMPPSAGQRLRHTESEQSSDGGEESKRYMLGCPLMKGGVGDVAGVVLQLLTSLLVAFRMMICLFVSVLLKGRERAALSFEEVCPKTVGRLSVLDMKGVTDTLLDLLCESADVSYR